MTDETEFHKALVAAGNYINIELEGKLLHPTEVGRKLFIDNWGQKDKTVFVFEGKRSAEERAVSQLKKDYLSLKQDRLDLISRNIFTPYNTIRLFYYSFKKRILVEYNEKSNEVARYQFSNLKELANVLRNI